MVVFQEFFVCYSFATTQKSKIRSQISGNYRAIALSSVSGKVFHKIIIDKQSAQLSTSDL